VLIHLNASTVFSRKSRQSPASNFLAARIGAFEAALCYAKFTPAALHRGELVRAARQAAEAVGRRAGFEFGDVRRGGVGSAMPALETSLMAAS
jgi:hypothetical protein